MPTRSVLRCRTHIAIRYFTFSHTLELFLEPFLGQHTPFAEMFRYQCRDHKLTRVIGWNNTAHSERDKHELRELIGPGDGSTLHRVHLHLVTA